MMSLRRVVAVVVICGACAPGAAAQRKPEAPAPLRLRMLAEEDARSTTPIALLQGLKGSDPELRRIAVRALGRLEAPDTAAAIVPFLSDRAAPVRVEAANALAQSVFAEATAEQVREAARALEARLANEAHPLVRGALALALGRLRYPTDEAGRRAAVLVLDVAFPKGTDGTRSQASPAVLVNALRGLYHSARARLLTPRAPREPGSPPVTWLSDEARETLSVFAAPRLECMASQPGPSGGAGEAEAAARPAEAAADRAARVDVLPPCTPLAGRDAPPRSGDAIDDAAGPRPGGASVSVATGQEQGADRRLARLAMQALDATGVPDTLLALALLWDPDDQVRAIALRWALSASPAALDEDADLANRWAARFASSADAARGEIDARAGAAQDMTRHDPSAQVRYEGVRRLVANRGTAACAAVADAMGDAATPVAVYAMEHAAEPCSQDEVITSRLERLTSETAIAAATAGAGPLSRAERLRRYEGALVGFARIAPHAARSRVLAALPATDASVRRAGAHAALALLTQRPPVEDPEILRALVARVDDEDANVATAAVQALATRRSTVPRGVFVRALGRDRYELVLEAAQALRPAGAAAAGAVSAGAPAGAATVPATATPPGTTRPDEASDADVVAAALESLDRLTRSGRETSRDPRLALVRLVADLGGADAATRLEPWLRDFDAAVATSAATAIGVIRTREASASVGAPTAVTAPAPKAAPRPRPRLPLPTLDDLARMASARIEITMRGRGAFLVRLRPDEAPLNAFRFLRLAEQGYYTGLTFHRLEPNFVLQGGSPEGNEYAGDGPFSRDEVGLLSNLRGSIGLSTRGRDTGDAQFYVNLVDNVRLDHAYTVFAQVESGMDVIDALVQGDVIERVEIR